MSSQQLNVLTIATGKKLYADMAVNLARSFIWWNKHNGIRFYIATDQQAHIPVDVLQYAVVMPLQPEEFGKGFSPKLHLDKIAPEGKTLFIDSDCMVYGNLQPVFHKFEGHAVSVIGGQVSTGEWFGDVGAICSRFGVEGLPKFNGGVYYFEQGAIAQQVYETARELEQQYDDIGFVRLRNRPNDEVLMALAMALNGQLSITEDGSILAEFVNFKSGIRSDVLSGVAELYNTPGTDTYVPEWPLHKAKPLIVHYLGHHNQTLPYVREAKQLALIFRRGLSVNTAKLMGLLSEELPQRARSAFKYLLRPFYRAVAGTRPVPTSERIIE